MDDGREQCLLHYGIIEELGEGGSGQVFKAWDTVQQRIVALKLLKPQLTKTVAFRAHCLSAVNALTYSSHPHICPIFGIHKVDETFVIVMEYLEGATLKELIRYGPLDNSKFLDIATQIVDGLKYAHEQLITHGNLKPSNIMVTERGQIKIIDFGLSCYCEPGKSTGTDPPLDALHYLAAEQITGEPVIPLADLFSLGVLFYELLTGGRPFSGDTREAVENSILRNKPDFQIMRARKIPGDTILMIEKLLAKEPTGRFSNAGELLITLQEMQSFERESFKRKFLQVTPQSPRQYLLISLLAALLLVLWYVLTTYHH